jgi:hypothetical protein
LGIASWIMAFLQRRWNVVNGNDYFTSHIHGYSYWRTITQMRVFLGSLVYLNLLYVNY